MAFVVIAADGGVLDGAAHPFNLPIDPGMVRLGEPVLDVMGPADAVERMTAELGDRPQSVFR